MFHAVFVFSALASALVAHAQSFGSPLPAADAMFPLILRTPYFTAWVEITESSLDLALYVWPSFWDSTVRANFLSSMVRSNHKEFVRSLIGVV